MYRCSECKAIFENKPDYCDCGNDVFEELTENVRTTQNEMPKKNTDVYSLKKRKRKLQDEDYIDEKERKEKKKVVITLCISAFIAFIVLVSPPYPKKHEKVKIDAESSQKQITQIPSVEVYWDKSLPSSAKEKDPHHNIPVLNKTFPAISPVMRQYLVNIGGEFNKLWNKDMINGDGTAKITFTINKDGVIEYKTLSEKSHNESLDDSVLMLLSKINSLDVPPDEYKGEKIILAFISKGGVTKIQFP